MKQLFRRYDINSIDNRKPERIQFLFRWIHPILLRYFRARVEGVERIPPGAGLYVGNHSSGILTPDSFIFCGEVFRAHGIDEVPFGLGHEVVINLPLLNQIIVPLGAVRASHATAHRLFARGKKVLVYPGGDIDSLRPFIQRDQIVFGNRRGYIRLAIREAVPIIPVISAGSQETLIVLDDANWLTLIPGLDRLLRMKVWPTTLSLPWGLTFGPPLIYFPYPTRILIEILEPIRFDRTGQKAAQDEAYIKECGNRVLDTMQNALDRLAKKRRQLDS
jgi:1-acyl-sn-glycerol-3-phosphate acyltransferase